ncbi:NRDE family protein [Neobacillus notoginsengisoli]|uniref:NRDE family protein n=2 Tax=Neobacillus notoginsengisoli TaxID=1578198 RepID=A0A417YEX2_9BACI|nr:NRDE family protein [Neobacillus notoginsengisoli]RHW31201.1 NRDE family protein [Neobacillus notoginsengisoli]
MCLILFAYQAHPKYRLIVAANRDENYARPTAPADFWPDEPDILAGRDLEKMGTWMGITTGGRFAALTNYRDPEQMKASGKLSRGELVADYLKGKTSPTAFMASAKASRERYPGYNLLAGDQWGLFYYSNIEGIIREIEPGIHGLSNHLLNTPWPKVEHGKRGLQELLQMEVADLPSRLFGLLQQAEPAPDTDLPDTGIGLEWERVLSPLFIRSEGYGTRCSTILLMGQDQLSYIERNYTSDGFTEKEFVFPLKNETKKGGS